MKRRTPPRGFSLLEVMLAGVVLLVGLAGVLSGITAHFRVQEHQRHMTQAIHIAESVLEKLVLTYPSDTDLAEGLHGPLLYDATAQEVTTGGTYEARWNVTAGEPLPGVKLLEVRVRWNEQVGVREYSLKTWRR